MATTATTFDQVVAVHGSGDGNRRHLSVGRVLAWTESAVPTRP